MICPCKDCKKRSLACHDICYDYIVWNKDRLKTKAAVHEAKKKDTILNLTKYKAAEKKRRFVAER